MDGRRGSPARLLAPISLVAFVFALFVVIGSSDTSDDSDRSGDRGAEQTQPTSTVDTGSEPRVSGNFYTVKTGDTLGAIADAVGLPLARLIDLNPGIDAQQLVSGQKIRIRE